MGFRHRPPADTPLQGANFAMGFLKLLVLFLVLSILVTGSITAGIYVWEPDLIRAKIEAFQLGAF